MNYLAHIFLSGEDGKLQIGNFIGDAVKGRAYKDYPEAVADGILLHRAIDSYTDSHPAVREAGRGIKPYFGRYSGIVLDIYFDYLLASRFGEFSPVPLKHYTRRFYRTMILNRRYLPGRIRRFMWHFIATDRLGKYASTEGIAGSLDIMTGVHRIDISPQVAVEYLTGHEEELFAVFKPFFEELRSLCEGYVLSDTRREYLERFLYHSPL